MQNRFLDNQSSKTNSAKIPFLTQLGPLLLLGSFAAIILKSATLYWPLALTAFIGYATILYLKKSGFYLSLLILAFVSSLLIRMDMFHLWPLMLTSSIGLSWLLIFLSHQEISSIQLEHGKTISALEETRCDLEKQLREAKISLSKESKDLLAEKERLNALLIQAQLQSDHLVHSLNVSEKEKEKWKNKSEILLQDIFNAQRKEAAFQHALEDAQVQLLKLKNQMAALEAFQENEKKSSNLIPIEEDLQEKVRFEQLEHQYANLREQFEEKSEALDQARRELFKTENELLVLKKNGEEKAIEMTEEELRMVKDYKAMEEELREQEALISSLQEFVTVLLSPKKRSSRTKKSVDKLEDGLPFLLQEKIDQMSSESI